ncbi:MAG: hypothetical protein ACXVO1_06075 [Tumebacillaceae bacterium]
MQNLQLQLGSLFEAASNIGLFLSLPILTTLIVLVCIKSTRRIFKWAGIIVLVTYVGGYVCDLYLIGATYDAARLLNIYVPWNAHQVEDKHDGAMDEEEMYIVLQFSDSQMKNFEKQIQSKATWKSGVVAPDALFRAAFSNDTMMPYDERLEFTDQSKAPLPSTKTDCLYFTSVTKRNGKGDFYMTRKVYVLDKKSKTLYLYYDDSQWG